MAGPALRPYEAPMIPAGQIQTTAQPADFGAQVGAGMMRVGQGTDQAAGDLFRVENDQAYMEAGASVGKAELAVRQQITDSYNKLDPNDPAFPQKLDQWQQSTQQLLHQTGETLFEGASNRVAGRYIAHYWSNAASALGSMSVGMQARAAGDYAKFKFAQNVNTSSQVVEGAPDNNTYLRQRAQLDSMVAGLSVEPGVKLQLEAQARQQLALSQVGSLVSAHPHQFLSEVGGGKTAPGVAPTAITNFNAPVVKPYGPQQVASIASMVKAPSQYDATFKAAGAKYNVPWQELKMRAAAESGLNPTANSGQSQGIMQLTPATAKQLGVNPMDPTQAIYGAAKLVSELAAKNGGDATAVDRMYYDGEVSKFGPNANQYGANLSAVRAALNGPQGDPQIQPMSEEAIAKANPQIAGWGDMDAQQRFAAVRKAESLAGKGLAVNRGQLAASYKDALASYANGDGYPNAATTFTLPALTNAFGAAKGQVLYNNLQTAQKFGGFMSQLSTMPVGQAQAWLAANKPAGGEGAATSFTMYNLAEKAAAHVMKLRAADPVAFAIQHGIGNAQPLNFQDPNAIGGQLKARVALAHTMSTDYGTPYALLSKPEVTGLTQALDKMPAVDKVSFLHTLATSVTDPTAWHSLMGQLGDKDKLLSYMGHLTVMPGTVQAGGQNMDGSTVAEMVAEGDSILNPAKIKTRGPGGTTTIHFDNLAFDTALRTMVPQATWQAMDAGMGAQAQTQIENAVKAYYVAGAYHGGQTDFSSKTPVDTKLLKTAFDAVTGGQISMPNGANLLLPWGMNATTFQNEFQPRALAALEGAGWNARQAQAYLSGARAVNVGNGRYGLMIGSLPVTTPSGTGGLPKPVIIDYAEPWTPVAPSPTPVVMPSSI